MRPDSLSEARRRPERGTAPAGVAVNTKSRLKASPDLPLRGSAKASRLPCQEPAVRFHEMLVARPMICQCHSRSWPMGLLSYCGQRCRISIRFCICIGEPEDELSNLLLHLVHILDRVLVRIGPVAVGGNLDLDRRLGRERVRPVIAARGSR